MMGERREEEGCRRLDGPGRREIERTPADGPPGSVDRWENEQFIK